MGVDRGQDLVRYLEIDGHTILRCCNGWEAAGPVVLSGVNQVPH